MTSNLWSGAFNGIDVIADVNKQPCGCMYMKTRRITANILKIYLENNATMILKMQEASPVKKSEISKMPKQITKTFEIKM